MLLDVRCPDCGGLFFKVKPNSGKLDIEIKCVSYCRKVNSVSPIKKLGIIVKDSITILPQ